MDGSAGTTTVNVRQLSAVLGAMIDDNVQWIILPNGPVRLSTLDQRIVAIISPVTV